MIYYVDEDGRELYTEQTKELNQEVNDALAPIFEKYFKLGYKRHEIEYLMGRGVNMVAIQHEYVI